MNRYFNKFCKSIIIQIIILAFISTSINVQDIFSISNKCQPNDSLQIWSIFAPILNSVEPNCRAQLEIELITLVKMVFEENTKPYPNFNATFAKWYSNFPDKRPILNLHENPRKEESNIILVLNIASGEDEGKVFEVSFSCSDFEQLFFLGKNLVTIKEYEPESIRPDDRKELKEQVVRLPVSPVLHDFHHRGGIEFHREGGNPQTEITANSIVNRSTDAEFRWRDRSILSILYEIKEPEQAIKGNPHAQEIMRNFHKFENINFDLLQLLYKQDKTIADFFKLLDLMRRMAEIYLHTFKGYPKDISLEEILVSEASSTKEEKAKIIAEMLIKMEQRLKELLASELSITNLSELDKVDGVRLLPKRVDMEVQRYNGERALDFIGVRTSEYLDQFKTEDIFGISLAELINIVHQKGIRNLPRIIEKVSGEKVKFAIDIKPDNAPDTTLGLQYYDARGRGGATYPLPVKYIAKAFAKREIVNQQSCIFSPSRALILSDEEYASIGMELGHHTARIQFTLKPIQEGGRVVVNYTDSGPAYFPGSVFRIKAMAEAFEKAGFKVRLIGYTLDASFGKDSEATSIDELPEKLEFAINVLGSMKNLDERLNEAYREEDFRDKVKRDQIIRGLSEPIARDGYLRREGNPEAPAHLDYFENSMPKILQTALGELVLYLAGSSMPKDVKGEIGQRALDRIKEQRDLLLSRGAIKLTRDGIIWDASYAKAWKRSPVSWLLSEIMQADKKQIEEFRKAAAIAKAVEKFSSRRILGFIGECQLEQLTLPLLGDRVTFYTVRDKKDSSFYLAIAVLGNIFHNKPRVDLFRGKVIPHNRLNIEDLREILSPQNVTTSRALQSEIGEFLYTGRINGIEIDESIFDLVGNRDFLDLYIPQFDTDKLFKKSIGGSLISSVSLGGISLSEGFSIGRAVINSEKREAREFKNGILIDSRTTSADDEKIAQANGVILTTGGILSHAGIRTRELRKPGAIFLSAEKSSAKLSFRRFKGVEKKSTIKLFGKDISFYELSDYSVESFSIKEGDLIALDAANGIFYYIADASDMESADIFNEYIKWKKNLGQHSPNTSQRDLLAQLLLRTSNDNLLRAIINDLLSSDILSLSNFVILLTTISSINSHKGEVLRHFLNEMRENAVSLFHLTLGEYKRELRTTDDPNEIYLIIDDLLTQASMLEHIVMPYSRELELSKPFIYDSIREVLTLGRKWVRKQQRRLRKEVKLIKGIKSLDLVALKRIEHKLKLLGLKMIDVSSNLSEIYDGVKAQREREAEFLRNRGVIWKSELQNSTNRSIGGGKSVYSAEAMHALIKLKEDGLISKDITIGIPLGFVVESGEFELWEESGKPKKLNENLKNLLAEAYLELVQRQAHEIRDVIQRFEHLDAKFQRELIDLLSEIDEKMAGVFKDYTEISSFIDNFRQRIVELLTDSSKSAKLSEGLRRQLEVLGALAVRSSGIGEDKFEESKAGTMASFINVMGVEDLFKRVVDVWKSGSEAVLIEEMIYGVVSGVAFSAEVAPRKRTSNIRILSDFGLASGIVGSLDIEPDSYLIRKKGKTGTYEILSAAIGTSTTRMIPDFLKGGLKTVLLADSLQETSIKQKQSSLSQNQLLALANVIEKLSDSLGYQIDIEYSIDSYGRIFILQMRPITTIRRSIERGRKAVLEDKEFKEHVKKREPKKSPEPIIEIPAEKSPTQILIEKVDKNARAIIDSLVGIDPGGNCPIDIVVDLSLIPKTDMNSNAEAWAYLIILASHLKNVNFIFDFPFAYKNKDMSIMLSNDLDKAVTAEEFLRVLEEILRLKVEEYGLNLNVSNIMETRIRANRRKGGVEIPILSSLWLEWADRNKVALISEETGALKYPVSLDPPELVVRGASFASLEVALAIGLAKAKLAIAKNLSEEERGDKSDFSTLKKQLFPKLRSLYSLFDMGNSLNEDTLEFMVARESAVRLVVAKNLTLPNMIRLSVQQLRHCQSQLSYFLKYL